MCWDVDRGVRCRSSPRRRQGSLTRTGQVTSCACARASRPWDRGVPSPDIFYMPCLSADRTCSRWSSPLPLSLGSRRAEPGCLASLALEHASSDVETHFHAIVLRRSAAVKAPGPQRRWRALRWWRVCWLWGKNCLKIEASRHEAPTPPDRYICAMTRCCARTVLFVRTRSGLYQSRGWCGQLRGLSSRRSTRAGAREGL